MRLHYFQSCENPLDPLRKLGAKVQPKKPESPEAIRAREVEAFERGVYNAVKAAAEETGLRNFARSFAHDGTGYIEPEPVVSFADAAEMADGWIKWDGGECPCRGQQVMVRYRDGQELGPFVAGYSYDGYRGADGDLWDNCGYWNDIIAYRVIKPAAEVVEKKAVTLKEAWDRVCNTHGIAAAIRCRNEAVGRHLGHDNWSNIEHHHGAEAAAIAALEALR